ncbi:hypothetical protein AVEN_198248-1 [Araneus ventricosus]|uniref:Uncharacterized protein n=1 Tax=Araneus ventricosus TaxID=182803 RepID=A0A4Y2X197_ARAVE|nr:hypothetical protein AVEN_198248-1 [Araneus ventricosus]
MLLALKTKLINSNTFFLTRNHIFCPYKTHISTQETDSNSPTTRPTEQTDSPIGEVEQQFSSEIQSIIILPLSHLPHCKILLSRFTYQTALPLSSQASIDGRMPPSRLWNLTTFSTRTVNASQLVTSSPNIGLGARAFGTLMSLLSMTTSAIAISSS